MSAMVEYLLAFFLFSASICVLLIGIGMFITVWRDR